MITKLLQLTDKNAYSRWVDFNVEYLNQIKVYLADKAPPDMFVKNILAKDEVDRFKYSVSKTPPKLHTSLLKVVDERVFYGVNEKSIVNGILTYMGLTSQPDLEYINSKLAPLQEIHQSLTSLEAGKDSVTVFAKLIYNRSRIMHILYGQGLSEEEYETKTYLGDSVSAHAIAELLCRVSGIHHALRSMSSQAIACKDYEIGGMIKDIAEAMLSYRKSLIDPEKAGLGDIEMAAGELELVTREPSPAAGVNLKTVVEKYVGMDLAFTPTDFLLCLNEAVRLSGIDLMV